MKLVKWFGMASLAVAVTAFSAQAQEPITIGVLTDMSGIYSDITGEGSVLAAQMAIDEFGGEVAGRPIRLLVGDHLHRPDLGSNIAREWIDQERVHAIVDVPNSGVLLAVQEIVRNSDNTIILASGGQTGAFNNANCSPYGFQWTTNSYAISHGLGNLAREPGSQKWFFVQADYAFGDAVTHDLKAAVENNGGEVVGMIKHPLNNVDFASHVLQAQASGADVITFISAGTDLTNALTQATEFGVEQRLTTSSLYVNTVKAVGLEMVQGLISSDAYYWDQSPEAAEWSKRFMARHSLGNAPTAIQIGVYSGVRHYLQAIKTAGTADREAALAALRAAPVNDAFVKDGFVREDGLMLHSQLILQAKTPEESTGDWDVFNVLRVVPAEDAYSPLSKSECSLVTKAKQ